MSSPKGAGYEPIVIACPACGADAKNDPLNTHLVAHGDERKGFTFTDGFDRRFAQTWFCTKCTRATPFAQLPAKTRKQIMECETAHIVERK